MSKDISYQEYWQEIEDLAKEVKKRGGDESDNLHEAIDGHQWVIYTSYCFDVLKHTKNEEAAFDVGVDTNNFGQCMQTLVYWAMYQDVAEALADLPEVEELDAASE